MEYTKHNNRSFKTFHIKTTVLLFFLGCNKSVFKYPLTEFNEDILMSPKGILKHLIYTKNITIFSCLF